LISGGGGGGEIEDPARTGGVDEFEAWKGVVRELDRRGVGECRVFGQGAVDILVSEKEDLERLEEVLMLLPDEQRRKYKITLGIDYVSTRFLFYTRSLVVFHRSGRTRSDALVPLPSPSSLFSRPAADPSPHRPGHQTPSST